MAVQEEFTATIPMTYKLGQNYPNPFNAQTALSFSIPQTSHVKMVLINILGKIEKEICNEIYQAGKYDIHMDGSTLSSGVYFCRMSANASKGSGQFRDIRKIVLIK